MSTMMRQRATVALGFACAVGFAAISGAGCSGGGGPTRARGADAAASVKAPAPAPAPEPAFGVGAIDAAIRAAWQAAGITPAGRVDDAGFIRRVWLDIGGTLPAPEVVAAFLAETAPDKRAKAVEAVLASPRYVERWTDAWDEILIGRVRSQVVDRPAFRRWLRGQFAANAPWDKIVVGLVTATGKNSAGGARYAMDGPEVDAGREADEGVNGAVNWVLKYSQTQQDLPAAASRVFLGVQIQCAQCHDHKAEKWKQDDFRSFAACFSHVQAKPVGEKVKNEVRVLEVRDGERARVRKKDPDREAMAAIAAAEPRALDGSDLSASENRRQALAAWMVSPGNPWFARAIVNRMWGMMLGRGFVDPVDDLRPGNPGVLPELEEKLARDFVAHGYDLKHLIRTIAATEVYQRAAAAAQGKDGKPAGDALWPRFRVRAMAPEVLLNAILAATGLDPFIEQVAGERRERLRGNMRNAFGFLFDVDEEAAEEDYEGTIPQALMLLNGALTAAGTSASIPGAALRDALAKGGSDAEVIEALYLRSLSRRPSAAEVERWTRYVGETRDVVITKPPARAPGKPGRGGRQGSVELPPKIVKLLQKQPEMARHQAFEDVFWALLNSSEFFFNH